MFGDTLAAHASLLRCEPGGVHGLARLAHELLRGDALFIERAQLGIRILQRAPRYGELGLHLEPPRQCIVAARFELHDRLVTPGELLLQLVAAPCQLLALLNHAVAAYGHRALRGAPRFDANEQIARGPLRLLPARPRGCDGFAPLLLLALQVGAPRIQLTQHKEPAIEL